jgi:hypothetical protein
MRSSNAVLLNKYNPVDESQFYWCACQVSAGGAERSNVVHVAVVGCGSRHFNDIIYCLKKKNQYVSI